MCSPDCFLAAIAILFPPIAVWVKRGVCSVDSVINLALCMLGFLPGLFHAWYIIAKYPDPVDSGDSGYAPIDQEAHIRGIAVYQQSQQRQPPRQGALVYSQHNPAPARGEGYGSFSVTPASEPYRGQTDPSEGSANQGFPPSYASAVKGDNKVQHD